MDDFAAFLCELRENVHIYGLQAQAPGDADREVVREIASRLGLQARFKHVVRFLGISAGLLATAAAVPDVATPAGVLGGAVAVIAAVWRGYAPRQVGKMRWLRWMVRFDVEDQVRRDYY